MKVIRWDCNRRYAFGLLRALLGAMIFALPLMMTQEMWELGAVMDPLRLATLLVVTLPMLVALSFYAGFEKTFSLLDNVLDAFAAMAVSTAACAVVLGLLGEITLDMPVQEIVGKLTVLSFCASIGALLADKQFNDDGDGGSPQAAQRGFLPRLFVMAVGAIFLALNIAPTQEVQIIAANLSAFQAVLLACVSFALLYLIVVIADPDVRKRPALVQLRRSFAGYGICLLLSAGVLWFFGRLDRTAPSEAAEIILVLAFPAALGAGAARLILGSRSEGGES